LNNDVLFSACTIIALQAARNALRSEEVLIQMSEDWAAIDVETIIAQTLYAIQPLDVPQQYMAMVPQCEFVILSTLYQIIYCVDDPYRIVYIFSFGWIFSVAL
jgi:hypothetical protein